MLRTTSVALLGLGILALATLSGCGKPNAYQPPPPPKVDVALPVTKPVEDYLDFTGTTRATDIVELRARVGGYLKSIHFTDGSYVKKGDVLFVIEPEPFEVALELAEANLQKALASQKLAKANLARTEPLARRSAVSAQELDIARANLATANAEVLAAEAAIDKAQLDLNYTRIEAPISGRIGRHLIDVGNLVTAQTDLLTTIESFEPIFAYFTVSENDVLRLMEMRMHNTQSGTTEQPRELLLGLTDEGGFPYRGSLDFAEVGVDASTGTQLRRGIFQNEDRRLLPGLFVRVRLPLGEPEPRLLIDERAIAADQRGEYVLVVNDEDVVEYRPVGLGMRVAGMRVVETGVKAGEWIVVNGLQRARPGAPVTPVGKEEAVAETDNPAPEAIAEEPSDNITPRLSAR